MSRDVISQEDLNKIRNWCAYQERSQEDVRRKLFSYRISSDSIEETIATLIAENFINEERFALMFAGGKFRMKKWGRNKIKNELRKHKVSEPLIKKALSSIETDDYENVITQLISKKTTGNSKGDQKKEFYRTLTFMVSRGFEAEIVSPHLEKVYKNIDI